MTLTVVRESLPVHPSPGLVTEQPSYTAEHRAVDRTANHVGKLATILALATTPGAYQTQAELVERITELQGSIPTWTSDRSGKSVMQLCTNSLVSVGLVETATKATARKQDAAAVRLTERGMTLGLAIAGTFLPPQIDGISLATVWGPAQQAIERGRPPSRVLMYQELLGRPNNTASLSELARHMELTDSAAPASIDTAARHGIVTIIDRDAPSYKHYVLIEPTPSIRQDIQAASPDVRPAVHAAMNMWDAGLREVTGEDILDEAMALYPQDQINPDVLWRKLQRWVQRRKTVRFIQTIPPDDGFSARIRTLVQLRPHYVEPVRDLLERRALVATSESYRKKAIQTAERLMEDSDSLALALEDRHTVPASLPSHDTTPEGIRVNSEQRATSAALVKAIHTFQASQGIH